jgi:outer membrane autotransporter protein
MAGMDGGTHRAGRGLGRRLPRLAATTALVLISALSPALSQTIVAEGAVDPAPPADGPWIADHIRVGNGAAGSLTASDGAWIAAETTSIGYGALGNGTVVLTGDGTALDNSFGLYVGLNTAQGGEVDVEGELQIRDGAAVRVGSVVEVGSGDGAFGRLIVSGANASLGAADGSTSAPGITIGAFFGSGEMLIESGGYVGTGASYIDTGTVTVDGAGSLWEASFLYLMDDDSLLSITDGGRVHVGVGGLLVGSARLDADGEGSRLDVDGPMVLGEYEAADSLLRLSNGAVAVADGYVSVGERGRGELIITGGSTLSSASADIGYEGDARGLATIIGEGSRWNSASFVLGSFDSAAGTLIVADGGVASAANGAGGIVLSNEQGTAGTLVVGAMSGEEAQAAGTVEAASIVFGAGDGRLVLNHTGMPGGGALRFESELAGTGSILHENGTTYLDRDGSAFSGLTTVTGGRLMVMNDLGGSFTVGDGGFLGGVSTIGSGSGSTVTLDSGGRLGGGDPLGTLGINGNLVFETGSIFEVRLPASPPSGLVTVSGTVDAANGRVGVVTLDAETSYTHGQTWRILETQGGFLTEFGGVDSDSAFLAFLLDHSSGGLDLIVQAAGGAVDFSDVALTPNQRATALALNGLGQSGPSLALYNALLMLGPDAARGAFDQLSGEIHASAKAALVEQDGRLRDLIGKRLSAAFAESGKAIAPMGYWGGGAAIEAAHSPLSIWASATGHRGRLSGDDVTTLDHSGGGLVFGADVEAAGWRLGVVGGHGLSAMETGWSSLDASSWHLGAYAGSEIGAITIRSGLVHGWHDIESDRRVSFAGFEDRLSADYGARSLSGFGEVGYRMRTAALQVEPYAGLAHIALRTGGYAEEGGAAALTSDAQTQDATMATLGMRMQTDLMVDGRAVHVGGNLAWRRVLGDAEFTSAHAFAGGSAFEVEGAPIARDAALLGFDLGVPFANGATLSVGYDGQFARSGSQHTVNAGFSLAF